MTELLADANFTHAEHVLDRNSEYRVLVLHASSAESRSGNNAECRQRCSKLRVGIRDVIIIVKTLLSYSTQNRTVVGSSISYPGNMQ
jgi:hypothetical protein